MIKTTHRATWAVTALTALFVVSLEVTPQMNAADHLPTMQATALVATAKTPADHMKLAAYFKLEAYRPDAETSEHEELPRTYRLNPAMTGGGKIGGNTQIRTFEH